MNDLWFISHPLPFFLSVFAQSPTFHIWHSVLLWAWRKPFTSKAISQKGFMLIFTLASSTPVCGQQTSSPGRILTGMCACKVIQTGEVKQHWNKRTLPIRLAGWLRLGIRLYTPFLSVDVFGKVHFWNFFHAMLRSSLNLQEHLDSLRQAWHGSLRCSPRPSW